MSPRMTVRLRYAASFGLLIAGNAAQCWAAPGGQPADCRTLQKHGHRAEAEACYGSLVRSGSAYLRAEGYWGPDRKSVV